MKGIGKLGGRSWLAVACWLVSGGALAERPMAVDDAGTLDRGGAKIEFGWSRDDKVKGFEAAVGYGPFEKLEMELAFGRARDRSASPSASVRAVGAAVKWVPLQQETGLSAGLKYEYGDEHVQDGANGHAQALLALLSWRFDAGPLVHVNLGREWARAGGQGEAGNVWGVGLDWPVGEALSVTLETYGAQHAAPDRQLGLRYEIMEGLKVSGAVGRGNARSVANLGVAWEF